MAEDYTSVSLFPTYKTFTASNTTATEIKLPKKCTYLELGSETHKLYIGRNGATDGEAMPAHKMFIPKDNIKSIKIGAGLERVDSIFVQASGGSATVCIELSEK